MKKEMKVTNDRNESNKRNRIKRHLGFFLVALGIFFCSLSAWHEISSSCRHRLHRGDRPPRRRSRPHFQRRSRTGLKSKK
jgi:hypothetical protein